MRTCAGRATATSAAVAAQLRLARGALPDLTYAALGAVRKLHDGRVGAVRRREAADAGHTPWQVAAKRDEPTDQYERAGSVKVVPQLAKVVKAQTRAGKTKMVKARKAA